MTPLAELFALDRRIAVTGMCKNAGKTTVLNALIASLPGRLGLTSVGRDGETTDVSTGTGKPAIFVPEGTLAATAERLLPLSTVSRTILALSDAMTPLGRVAIVRCDTGGRIELAGSSTVTGLTWTVAALESFGADRILIDGALSRRSVASPALADGVALATGFALGRDPVRIAEETAFAVAILSLPVDPGEGAFRIEGALTDALLETLLSQKVAALSVSDPTRVLLSRGMLERLKRTGVPLSVRARPALRLVTVNPFAPDGTKTDATALIEALQERTEVPVWDIKEFL